MRITNSILYRAVKQNVQTASQNIQKYQEQLSSGKRINRPSDDPLGAMRAQQIHTNLNKIDQHARNTTYAKSWLNTSETALSQSSDLLIRLKELAVTFSSDNTNADARQSGAEEVRNIKDQLMALANTKVGNRTIFAGHQTDSPAFLPDGTYSGNDGQIEINLNSDITVKVNLIGDQVFESDPATDKNIFATLDDMISSLESNDREGISNTLDELDTAFSNVNKNLSIVGSRQNQVENVNNTEEDKKVTYRAELGQVEEVDIVDSMISLEGARNTFQAALVSSSGIGKLSLANYI